MSLSPNAPIILGVILGVLAIFILGITVFFLKRVKEEDSHQDSIPTARPEAAEQKSKKKSKKSQSEEESGEGESDLPEEGFLFSEEGVNIIPQGVRTFKQSSAPWNFSEQDKDRFGTPEGEVPTELVQPLPVENAVTPTPPPAPMTRRARRDIEWD